MLDYTIGKFERALDFQVTKQSTKYTNALKQASFTASNGWTITTADCPELNVKSKTIYLRGADSSKDLRVDRTWDLSSDLKRDQIVSEATHALEEFRTWVNWYQLNPAIVFPMGSVMTPGMVLESASKPDSGKNVVTGKIITG